MEPQVNTPAPAPTERSQIGIVTANQPATCRFNSVKKGEQAYAKLLKAWAAYRDGKNMSPLHEIKGDMFDSTIDLSAVVMVHFVDLSKRAKFVPWG